MKPIILISIMNYYLDIPIYLDNRTPLVKIIWVLTWQVSKTSYSKAGWQILGSCIEWPIDIRTLPISEHHQCIKVIKFSKTNTILLIFVLHGSHGCIIAKICQFIWCLIEIFLKNWMLVYLDNWIYYQNSLLLQSCLSIYLLYSILISVSGADLYAHAWKYFNCNCLCIIPCIVIIYFWTIYGKQNTLGAKSGWPRKIVTKRSDTRVWPRLTMHLKWKSKANQKQYIRNHICRVL